jgi:ferredoxin
MSETLLGNLPSAVRRPLLAIGEKFFRPIPHIDGTKCIGCGKCAESCPPKAILIEDGHANILRKKCISCLCCQEMCPVGAVTVTRKIKF